MFRKSLSLTVQLLLTLVGLVVVATGVLTVDAYRTSRQNLEVEARDVARLTAQQREQTVARMIDLRYQQAEGFLTSVASLCGEMTPKGRLAWERDCARRALESFRATERASGARFEYNGGRVAEAGEPPANVMTPAPFARILPRGTRFDYGIRATAGRSVLTVEFPIADLQPFFVDRSGLGSSGDVFLIDAQGRFLTPPRHGVDSIPQGAAAVEPIDSCLNGVADTVDLDYRGRQTIHGLRATSAFVDPVCVDAHVSYDEAMAPAEVLLNQLLKRGLGFAVIGVLLSIFVAQWIASPVQRLARAAGALEAGDFSKSIPVSGPAEVRVLGRRLTRMARSLADLVGREQTARHEAEAANRTKDEFLGTVSHELRTPLTSILGWASLLRLGRLDAQTTLRAVDAIERSADAQARLVEDLLDVTRIVAGRLHLHSRLVPLADPVQAALEGIRPEAARKGVRLDITFDDEDACVFGDTQRLQQVASNLLINAVKFTPEGGSVSVRQHKEGDQLILTVADSGVGMSPDFLPHAFEQFRQAEMGNTGGQGLGLGLAIVRHLVMLHGGEVRASSPGVGMGATFTVSLPCARERVTRAPSPSQIVPEGVRLDYVRVLFVDDDEATRQVVQEVLERAGATVQAVSSVAEARTLMASWEPTVLISDIAMPNETGYEFVRTLRASRVNVPAIALTAYARRGDAEEALAAGFQVYMAKPIQAADLVQTVAKLTEHAGRL